MSRSIKGDSFSRAHLYVALAVLAILGIANSIVFHSSEGAAVTSLGPFAALFELASGRFHWGLVAWPLVYVVAAIFAAGITLQFVGRARGWKPIARLIIWGACWVAWCVSGDLAAFAMMD
jgi:hypothetical protein